MRFGRINLLFALLFAGITVCFASPHTRRGPTAPHFLSKRPAHAKPASQRAIDAERTTQIQTALISHGYLTGEPTGVWDASTQAALQKLQADNGWQTKLIPDSRAIIKLGLGPSTAVPESASVASSSAPIHEVDVEAIPAQQ